MDWLGYAAALLTTIAFIPQAYQVYRTGQTRDLSLGLFGLFSLGVFFWLLYGWQLNNRPMLLANTLTLALALYILAIKLRNCWRGGC